MKKDEDLATLADELRKTNQNLQFIWKVITQETYFCVPQLKHIETEVEKVVYRHEDDNLLVTPIRDARQETTSYSKSPMETLMASLMSSTPLNSS